MDKYKYKTVPLNDILHENGNTFDSKFQGMRYHLENINNSKPLDFGYKKSNNQPVSSNVAARYTLFNDTDPDPDPITVPTGCKKIRYFGVGGGGGKGGKGGYANDPDVPPGKKKGDGGNGGAGGAGGRTFIKATSVNPGDNIYVYVGAAGPNGNTGAHDNQEHPNNYQTQGSTGNSPGAGGQTYIKIGGVKLGTANGGKCGNGGGGGHVYDGPGTSNSYANGVPGNTGASGPQTPGHGSWRYRSGGEASKPGRAEIIWLYD